MALNTTMAVFSFLLGLALGSFSNVCILRIPFKKSIVFPPSSCPNCNKEIKFYDNIPLLSYIILRGKCRSCKNPISLQYPIVEAMIGLIGLSLFFKFGINMQFFMFLIFSTALVIIGIIDINHKIIPNVISIPGIPIGFLFSLMSNHIGWVDSLVGIVVGGGSLYIIALIFKTLTGKEGMGGGDIKLLGMIGAWLGWKSLPFVILLSSLSGTVIGTVSLMLSRKGLRSRIPFGPFLSFGALVYLFFGHEIIDWYFNLIGLRG